MTANPRRGRAGFAWMGVVALAVACAPSADPSSGTETASCPTKAGQSLCGTCGSECYYCATGTCPSDPCTDQACDGTAECSTVDSHAGHENWSYCGFCTSSSTCTYCAPGTCSSNPCSTVCDSTGGYGPVHGGSSGGSGGSSSGAGSSSGGVTTCGNCPGQLECSTIVDKCVVQSCTCYYTIDGSTGGSAWFLANGGCYMCQQNGINTGDCSAAENAAAQAIVNCVSQ